VGYDWQEPSRKRFTRVRVSINPRLSLSSIVKIVRVLADYLKRENIVRVFLAESKRRLVIERNPHLLNNFLFVLVFKRHRLRGARSCDKAICLLHAIFNRVCVMIKTSDRNRFSWNFGLSPSLYD
jgi:hypothetical protein